MLESELNYLTREEGEGADRATATDRSLRPISLRRPQFRYKRQPFPPGDPAPTDETGFPPQSRCFGRLLVSCH